MGSFEVEQGRFLIVANEGNITKTASRIHITQPTLSRQLMQLEEELGVTLFERGKNNITPTDAGVIFRRRAQELINLSEKVRDEVQQSDEKLTGEISIGCSETQGIQELSRISTGRICMRDAIVPLFSIWKIW